VVSVTLIQHAPVRLGHSGSTTNNNSAKILALPQNLPPTARDSIEVCRKLHYPYLSNLKSGWKGQALGYVGVASYDVGGKINAHE
jgi:hypothetical protein